MVTAASVKELRDKTGAGMMDCKKALVETGGDMDKAVDLLGKRGWPPRPAGRPDRRRRRRGVLNIHMGGKIGVLVEINCETDFVARTDEFKELATSRCRSRPSSRSSSRAKRSRRRR